MHFYVCLNLQNIQHTKSLTIQLNEKPTFSDTLFEHLLTYNEHASQLYAAGIPAKLTTLYIAVAQIPGWTAH